MCAHMPLQMELEILELGHCMPLLGSVPVRASGYHRLSRVFWGATDRNCKTTRCALGSRRPRRMP